MTSPTVTVEWKGDVWRKAAVPHLNVAAVAAAGAMRDEAFRQLTASQSPPTSKPGQIPHRDTGNLSDHLAVASPESLATPLHAAFGTSVPYGRTLELGGTEAINPGRAAHEMDSGRAPHLGVRIIPPRPWIWRSAMIAKGAAGKAFKLVAKQALRAGGLSR